MTRKDYVLIAKAISDGQFINCATKDDLIMNRDTRGKIAFQLADELKAQNPRFDRSRFLKAAGVAL